jgi:hypothetical protein
VSQNEIERERERERERADAAPSSSLISSARGCIGRVGHTSGVWWVPPTIHLYATHPCCMVPTIQGWVPYKYGYHLYGTHLLVWYPPFLVWWVTYENNTMVGTMVLVPTMVSYQVGTIQEQYTTISLSLTHSSRGCIGRVEGWERWEGGHSCMCA